MEYEYKIHQILTIVLEGDVKVEHDNKWRTYCEIIAQLEKQLVQTFSIIRGQCMEVPLDNTKHDPDLDITS